MLAFRLETRLPALRFGGHAIAFSPRGDTLAYAGGNPFSGSRCVKEVACWRPPGQALWTHKDRGDRRRVDLPAAQRVVEAIIRVGQAERTGIDYDHLQRWLFEGLLRPRSVECFTNTSPERVRPGSLAAVIGLDREILAMFWLG